MCFLLYHFTMVNKYIYVTFWQDVSDRIEKESVDSEVVKCLEKGGIEVVKYDWRKHISEELQRGMNSY